jgi:exodeoxyribonuclease-3
MTFLLPRLLPRNGEAELSSLRAATATPSSSHPVPTDADIYPTKSYAKNALVQPQPRALFQRLLDQGWVDAVRAGHPNVPMYTFWDYRRNRWARDAGLRIDHLLLNRSRSTPASTSRFAAKTRGAE